ncbi:class I SAM-dependent methyltransferase [Patescibacteria group bacterium]|nr:MAG: class I SAM-dependent methyltransferase [Patescibacteria group bacterium]
MSKPTNVPWHTYAKFGGIKYVRIVVRSLHKLLLMREPVWKDISYFKSEAKKYPQFTKGYRHWSKYYILYKIVRKLKPRFVLECGSGISTAIIISALRENGGGLLVSLDESPEYGNVVRDIVGSEVETHISPSVEATYEGLTGTKYAQIPDYPYDFIFVDGPQTQTVDLDAFYVLEKNPIAKVLIDCRVATVRALKQRFGGLFNPWVNLGFINFHRK